MLCLRVALLALLPLLALACAGPPAVEEADDRPPGKDPARPRQTVYKQSAEPLELLSLQRLFDLSAVADDFLSGLLGPPATELVGVWEAREGGESFILEFQDEGTWVIRIKDRDGRELGSDRGSYRIRRGGLLEIRSRRGMQEQSILLRYSFFIDELHLTAPNDRTLVLRQSF